MAWSPTKNTNVLVLLNALYTSGFASISPTVPRLTSRTLQTVYAVSFVIYSGCALVDWIHTYAVLNGNVTSFPIEDWFVFYMAILCVISSMLTILLMVLCIESAFAYRMRITQYRTGLAVIWEAFVEWFNSFNSFRVSFLFTLFHDLPMSVGNFFFVASCRCAGSELWQWTLVLSTISILISLLWRVVMIYFAYRGMIFPRKFLSSSNVPSRSQSFREQFENRMHVDQQRLWDLDESWPIRFSITRIYGEFPLKQQKAVFYNDDVRRGVFACIQMMFCCAALWVFEFFRVSMKRLACFLLCLLSYALCFGLGCLPCIHYYCCRRNSFSKRHKCSKSFVRYFSLIFHYSMMIFSTTSAVALIALNGMLLFSVHGVGSNNIPPEIYKVCYAVDLHDQTIHPYFLPYTPAFTALPSHSFNQTEWICKPLWENPATRERMHSGPWQSRIALGYRETLAISTHFVSNRTDPHHPIHTIRYDYVVMREEGPAKSCRRGIASKWRLREDPNHLTAPYFLACKDSIRLQHHHLIDC